MNDDVDRIMAVMQAAFDPAYGEAWTRRQVSDALALPNTYAILAGTHGDYPDDGEPSAGFVLSRGAAGEEELLLIAVVPEFRQQGIGKRLIERLVEEAGLRGVERIFLEMRDGNSASRLYTATHFRPVGRRKNYYRAARDGPIDAVTYVREITPARN